MKRLILLACLSFCILSTSYAASLLFDTINFAVEVSNTTTNAKRKGTNLKQLQLDLASFDIDSLGESERVSIFESRKLTTGGPFAKNLLLGFGSGSAQQGDTTGALIGIVGDSIGVGALGVSAGLFLVDLLTIQLVSSGRSGSLNTDSPLMKAALYTAIGGGAVLVATRIFESIRVFTYASKYNDSLRDGLGLDKNLRLAAAPIVDPYSGEPGMMFVAQIAL